MFAPLPGPESDLPERVAEGIARLRADFQGLEARLDELAHLAGVDGEPAWTRLRIFHGYVGVFVAAFVVTLLATPLMRRLAVANGIIDRPSELRKTHRMPVAYLGGVAVFLGLLGGILYSYLSIGVPGLIEYHPIAREHLVDGVHVAAVPLSVLLGMTVIMIVGLLDDVISISPRIKIAGQLIAAAALAVEEVGVKVAAGVLRPFGALIDNPDLVWSFPLPAPIPLVGDALTIDVVYWAGTAVIAVFVLGACNAANLLDGLDGLLSGVTGIAAAGLLVVALSLALIDDGPRDAQRIILCLALLGACLGFLPHNFNPATIFLGDCGSLLLGFSTIVIILTLGDTGKTFLVFAGLIIFAIPIIDTVLAIVRRKMAGRPISDPDDQHLHHMLRRAFGVKGAVLTLYGIGAGFAVLGVAMSLARARVIYALTLVFAAFVIVTAVKVARRKQIEEQASRCDPRWAPAAGLSGRPSRIGVEDCPTGPEPADTAPPEGRIAGAAAAPHAR